MGVLRSGSMSVEKMMAELGIEEEEFREVTETFMDTARSELELLETAVRMGAPRRPPIMPIP